MPTGRPHAFELTLSEPERAHLTALAASRTLPYSHVRRAQIILRSAEGETDTAIAERFGVTIQTVGHWRRRFHRHGLAGLSDAPRSGQPTSVRVRPGGCSSRSSSASARASWARGCVEFVAHRLGNSARTHITGVLGV